MEEGLGPGVVAAVGELSQEEAGELSLQSFCIRILYQNLEALTARRTA